MEHKTAEDIGTFTKPKGSEGLNAIHDFMQQSNPMAPSNIKVPVPEPGTPPSTIGAPLGAVDPNSTPVPPAQPEAQAQPSADAMLMQAVEDMDKAPEKTWEQRIKEAGITREKAMGVIDALMRTGIYTEAFPLTKSTTVTFQSRSVKDHEESQNEIERIAPQFTGTFSMILSKYNLAASLVSYGNQHFPVDTPERQTKVFEFIEGLPYSVFSLLLKKLSRFDTLVILSTDEGAVENF